MTAQSTANSIIRRNSRPSKLCSTGTVHACNRPAPAYIFVSPAKSRRMNSPFRLPSSTRRASAAFVIGLIAAIFAFPASSLAQHRARLSRGLTRQIQQNPDATVSVIAEGPQSEIDRIAGTYGLQVVSRFDSGARLTGTAAQVDRAAGDPALASLTEDERVVGTMAVTTQATGASQLWGRGQSNFDGITGKNVNVVVIDSGIAHHPDLDRRIVTWVDFVDPSATDRVDIYGHGTHVAGIIAGSGAGSRGADGGA